MKDSPQRKERILVVDDEESLALTLKAILQYHGYEAATAFSGEDAITTAAIFVPDLLLSDIRMGGMDGIEAARHITATLPKCKVLFLSGHIAVSQNELNSAKDFQFEFASKPVPPPALVKRISEMLTDASSIDHVVLTVVHDDILRYALVAKLAEAGFIVREARTGAEALDAIQGSTVAKKLAEAGFIVKEVGIESTSEPVQSKPDAMVLDVLLPDISGVEVHRAVMTYYPDMVHIPVIYLAQPHQFAQAVRETSVFAATKVLTIPVEPDTVVSVLKSSLSGDAQL